MQLPGLFERGFDVANTNSISPADAVKPKSRVRISPTRANHTLPCFMRKLRHRGADEYLSKHLQFPRKYFRCDFVKVSPARLSRLTLD